MSLYGYTTTRSLRLGFVPVHGPDRHRHRDAGELLPAERGRTSRVSVIGVLKFTGLTAYDTQRIKEMYYELDASTSRRARRSWAPGLYLSFINLFMMLMHLFGTSRQ